MKAKEMQGEKEGREAKRFEVFDPLLSSLF